MLLRRMKTLTEGKHNCQIVKAEFNYQTGSTTVGFLNLTLTEAGENYRIFQKLDEENERLMETAETFFCNPIQDALDMQDCTVEELVEAINTAKTPVQIVVTATKWTQSSKDESGTIIEKSGMNYRLSK